MSNLFIDLVYFPELPVSQFRASAGNSRQDEVLLRQQQQI